MKITKHIPAILLGVLFVAFGLAFFFNLMPAPDPKELNTNEQSFMALFGSTGYMKFVKVFEVVFGILLLIPKTRALGLILIAPIIVNIACYEMFIHKAPGIGFALLILNTIGVFLNKEKYQGILS
jgi:putative oxidoreductase